jgi:hypothetical protein
MGAWPAKRSYLLFSCKFAQGFFCAVPMSSEIPDFLVGPAWRFVAVLRLQKSRQARFDESKAEASIRQQGFYLFTAHKGCDEARSQRPKR